MKKKLLVFISCIVLSLALAAGVTFAFFDGSVRKSADFSFRKLSVSSTVTQEAGAVFTKAGQTSTVSLEVSAGADTASFQYGFTVKTAATTDRALAQSVLVRFDGEYLGTAAQVFDGEFSFSPDRYLTAGERAAHILELEYHLGAGAIHKNKRLDLSVTCSAWTADAAQVAFVGSADEFTTLMRDAQSGLMQSGFRIVLTGDITAPAVSSAVPVTVDLNGHALHTALTLGGAGKSRIISSRAAVLDALTLDHVGAYVELAGQAGVGAVTVAQADRARQSAVMASYARGVMSAGLSDAAVDVLGTYGPFAGSDRIAVSGEGYENGRLTPVQGVDARTAALVIGTEEILYTVYGTGTLGDTGDNLKELSALMNTQLFAGEEAKTVAYDLLLPAVLKSGARVEWRSSDPSTVSAAGKYMPGSSDLTLTLTAYLRFNGKTVVREFAVKVKNSKDKSVILREILDAYGSVNFGELGEKYYLPTPTSNVAVQKADPAYASLPDYEKAKMDAVNVLIAESGIEKFSYVDADKLIEDGHLKHAAQVDSLELVTATGIHRTMLNVTAQYADGTVEDSLAVYIDVASVTEAMKYLSSVAEDYGDIALNFRTDRFHRIDAYGNDRSNYEPGEGNGIYAFHGNASAEKFGKPTALGANVREGSFVLPDRYTNMSGGMTFASGGGEKVYYYFYYHFDDTAFFAENELPNAAAEGLSYITLGADAGAPTAEISSIPDFNNFFLIDPAKLPTNATTVNLQVGLYKKTGDTLTLEGTIQNIALPIPGAVHNDADGFQDKWVFDRAVSMLQSDPQVGYTACPLAPSDTILHNLCEDAASFVLDTGKDANPAQITGSIDGLGAYKNLKTLKLIGTEAKPLLSDSAIVDSVGEVISGLTGLTSLKMSYCGIEEISFVRSLYLLESLDLSNNAKLEDISGAIGLMRLTAMDVSYCGFIFDGADFDASQGLDFSSPYAEASVFEAICSADPDVTVQITYSYRTRGGAMVVAVYQPKFGNITPNQQKAKGYLAKFDFSSVDVYNKLFLPTKIAGVTDARLAYRVISIDKTNIVYGGGAGNYTQAVLTGGAGGETWGGVISPTATSLYVNSLGTNKVICLQIIVVLTDASGKDIPDAFYCGNYSVYFMA